MKQKIWSLALSLILVCSGPAAVQAAAERPLGVEGSMTSQSDASRIPLGGFVGLQQEDRRVIFAARNGRLAVSFLKNDMVRVRMAGAGEEFAPEDTVTGAIDKQEAEYDPVKVTVREEDDRVVMRTDALTVEADKATLALSFYNSDGTLITQNSETAMSFDKEGVGKSVGFVRDAAGVEEHFSGLAPREKAAILTPLTGAIKPMSSGSKTRTSTPSRRCITARPDMVSTCTALIMAR